MSKKKVGNACRTKNQIRSSKSRGSQAEYEAHYNLKKVIPDLSLTRQLGFPLRYDLVSYEKKAVFEVKKHKGFDWNELVKLFDKLERVKPEGYKAYLLFQANRQPFLVMTKGLLEVDNTSLNVVSCNTYFGITWERRPKGVNKCHAGTSASGQPTLAGTSSSQ